jgi:outer membrane protein OmpA-like peptidoglycan-associated protein
MRVKLIALVVAGLFAQNAYADEDFMWGGSAEAGGRGTNIDGANRNGAYGNTAPLSATNPLTPFTGPPDDAKAQEYQNINSAPIGVIDVRGGSRAYYLRAFGEEFGRDDQFINIVGGGYGSWKAAFYNNDIPHNYSFNAVSPLTNVGSTLLGFVSPSSTYPPATNPNPWGTWNYGTQRNTTGGTLEASLKSPWFVRADYNEVRTNGIKPSSTRLGTGAGNGFIEFGVPADYKTQNTVIEGGYNSKQYGFKLAFMQSKFSDANDFMQWPNFYMRNQLDTLLLPPDNDLKKWSINGYVKQLPWDSAIIARFTQSKTTNSIGLTSAAWTSGLLPTSTATSPQGNPSGVGYLFTQPFDASTNQNLTNFDGNIKKTTANVAWNASPTAQLDTRVYYTYYDMDNNNTVVSYRQGSQGSNCATPPVNSATCYQIPALTEEAGEAFFYTKNAAGFDASWAFNRTNKLLGGFDWDRIKRNWTVNNEDVPKSDDYRYWIEYKNTGWNDLSGWIKYEFLQQRSDISNANAATSVAAYYTPYSVNNFDRNKVKLYVDYTPAPLWLLAFGATWSDTDYKDNLYGRTKDKGQQYDATAAWGDDKLKITGIGNWGKIEYNQSYLAGSYPPPDPNISGNYNWGSQNTQDGWMAAALVDWAATDKLMLTASYTYQKTSGGVDFSSGNTQAGGGFNGGPLVNYGTDDTKLQRFQVKGSYAINNHWAVNAGYAYEKYDYSDGQMAGYGGYYPYFMNLNTAAVGSNYSWLTGAFANPSYTTNLVWVTATYKFDPPPQVYVAPKVAEAPKVAAAPPPPSPPPPPPPAPQVQKITLDSKVLFDFDKAVLKPEGKAAIDGAVVAKLAQIQKLEVVLVTGHTDPLGTEAYNQKLSERRAEAVRDYLVSKGVPKDKIEAIGVGEKQPIAGLVCNQKNLKERIACLQPDRRVEVEAKGETRR